MNSSSWPGLSREYARIAKDVVIWLRININPNMISIYSRVQIFARSKLTRRTMPNSKYRNHTTCLRQIWIQVVKVIAFPYPMRTASEICAAVACTDMPDGSISSELCAAGDGAIFFELLLLIAFWLSYLSWRMRSKHIATKLSTTIKSESNAIIFLCLA